MEKPTLSPHLLAELAAHNPIGREIDPDVVASWFEIVWPLYRRRRYKRHDRAIAAWWSRVTLAEVRRAEERLERIVDERLGAIQREIDQEIEEATGAPDFVVHQVSRG